MNFLPLAREPSLVDKVWMTLSYPVNLVRSPIQALVSIPALSFLVIPAFSSYSTSINLLFFYMTWAILIRSNPPLKVELFGTLGVRILFYVLPSLVFLAFDSAAPTLAVRIKEHGETALPMGDEQGGKKGRWWKITLVSTSNVLLSIALQMGIELLFTQGLHIRSVLRFSTSVPFPWSIAKDVLLGLLLREALTYTIHRFTLHSSRSPLTKMHKSWQHSLPAPFSLVAHYDHPLAYLVHVFLPTYLPALLFRFHLLTYHIYLAIVSLEETFAYSGYNALPSAFILGGIARRQETHLMGDGDGNYGCFGMADFIMGTSLGTDLMDDVVDETEEKRTVKKAKGKAKAVGKKARGRKEKSDDHEEEDRIPVEEDEEVVRPKAKSQRRKKSNNREPEEDGDGIEENERPERKMRNGKKGRKRSGDEDGSKGVEEEPKDVEGEKPKAKRLARKSSQRLKGRSRSKKRSEEEDD